jgi:DNA-binding MarR family transcriptional regulator
MTTTPDPFPPLSTSLPHFLEDGRDIAFREMIYRLLTVSAQMPRPREFYAAHIGVTPPQYSMLARIGEANTITMRELASDLHVSSPFIAAETGKLFRKGFLERARNDIDGRSVLLSLSEQGKDAIRKVSPMRKMANDLVFGSLNADQAQALKELLAILVRDFDIAINALEGAYL